ncbi:MAG: anthranilate phosphoribosyltransferase [Thermoanaerobaculia bacterium]
MSGPSESPSALLGRVMSGEDLARGEMEELVGLLMDGAVDERVTAALLVALAMKGESVAELAGAAAAMRRRVVAIPHSRPDAVDTCGTGGDGRGTFNISTAAALVAAAAGAAVAKHGNRSVSSRSGSADVLEALGVRIETGAQEAGRCLDAIGIAFLFAPGLHPAMRAVMPVRRALATRTLFNLLGPLTNPAGARRQVLGVYAADRVEIVARALAELGTDHALVVHGSDGLDEITISGPTMVAEARDGRVRVLQVEPRDFGVERAPTESLRGGGPADNAAALRRVLAGEPGPLRDVTVVNAAAALVAAGVAADWRDGAERAALALDEGAAEARLEALVAFHV